jgi:hypothetical protein
MTPFSQMKARQFDKVRIARNSDDLALFVDAIGFTVDMSGQRAERTNATFRRPNEGVQDIAVRKCGIAGESDDVAALVDVCRRIPPWRIEVPNVSHSSMLVPKDV